MIETPAYLNGRVHVITHFLVCLNETVLCVALVAVVGL